MGRPVRRVLSGGVAPRGRSSLSATRCRAAPAAYPGTRRAASSSPVWPCSGRGLPCGPCHHDPGGLLHHPFTLTPAVKPRRSALCGTVSRISPGGCYPPPCPVEPGRSSVRLPATRPSGRPIRSPECTRHALRLVGAVGDAQIQREVDREVAEQEPARGCRGCPDARGDLVSERDHERASALRDVARDVGRDGTTQPTWRLRVPRVVSRSDCSTRS